MQIFERIFADFKTKNRRRAAARQEFFTQKPAKFTEKMLNSLSYRAVYFARCCRYYFRPLCSPIISLFYDMIFPSTAQFIAFITSISTKLPISDGSPSNSAIINSLLLPVSQPERVHAFVCLQTAENALRRFHAESPAVCAYDCF